MACLPICPKHCTHRRGNESFIKEKATTPPMFPDSKWCGWTGETEVIESTYGVVVLVLEHGAWLHPDGRGCKAAIVAKARGCQGLSQQSHDCQDDPGMQVANRQYQPGKQGVHLALSTMNDIFQSKI